MRIVLNHKPGSFSGFTEIEVYSQGTGNPSTVTATNITANRITWNVTNALQKSLCIYDNNGEFVTGMALTKDNSTMTVSGLNPNTTYKAVLTDINNNTISTTYTITATGSSPQYSGNVESIIDFFGFAYEPRIDGYVSKIDPLI